IPHLPVVLIRERGEPQVRAINSFSLTVAHIRMKYLRLMNYQPSGLHGSQTLHLHLYVQTAVFINVASNIL
ncbi:hypothetical protein P692DRAFT_20915388, partial [Suillus brevipes Sb2]